MVGCISFKDIFPEISAFLINTSHLDMFKRIKEE